MIVSRASIFYKAADFASISHLSVTHVWLAHINTCLKEEKIYFVYIFIVIIILTF